MVKLITPPTQDPVTLDQVKGHLRILGTAEDNTLEMYRKAAVRHVENETGCQLMRATYELSLNCFPSVIRLPKPPLASVASITYTDKDGVEQTLPVADYAVNDYIQPAEITAIDKWPEVKSGVNVIKIRYDAGVAIADEVPASFTEAILLLIGWWYGQREAVGKGYEVPLGVNDLLNLERIHNI